MIVVWLREDRMVEGVKELGAEFHIETARSC